MSKIAILTDSNSGITQSQAAGLRVHVLPMPFTMDGESYFEDINLTQEAFYEKLTGGAEISTSQPSPGSIIERWNRLLERHDEVVHIPMSSGLSASYESAAALARDFDGRVQVVNNRRISVTLRQSAVDAVEMADAGWTAKEIKARLEEEKYDSSIYIMLNTLKYIRQGGRITAAGAAIGTLLNIKPVLQINGEKLDAYAKVRGVKQGRATLIDAVKKDLSGRFADFSGPENCHIAIAYTYDREAAAEFKREAEAAFPGYAIRVDPLSLSVSCHIGPGALALTCIKKLKI
ncbi:MAG: DegV family protein [Clostridiales bacterium]|jgi:DegV family protein with EDD domain|nr:DegV family protein [Clostridiales bacterium]